MTTMQILTNGPRFAVCIIKSFKSLAMLVFFCFFVCFVLFVLLLLLLFFQLNRYILNVLELV